MLSNIRQADAVLSLGLAFVGGYGDAASFVLARAFTGHVTGNLVLGAIAVAAHNWQPALQHLSAIVTFLLGIFLSVLFMRPLKALPASLSTIMAIEMILIVAACLAMASHIAHGVGLFVIFVSLALGLQNGALRRVGGISVHTTYLTGMITSLISTEAEKYVSESVFPRVQASDPKVSLLSAIWIAFVLGAGTGAAMVLHFHAIGMLGAAVLLITLLLRERVSYQAMRMKSNLGLQTTPVQKMFGEILRHTKSLPQSHGCSKFLFPWLPPTGASPHVLPFRRPRLPQPFPAS